MAEEKVLTKVIFEYSDGTSKFIEENELDRWNGFNRQVAVFCTAHRQNPDWSQVKWTWKKEEEKSEEINGDQTV